MINTSKNSNKKRIEFLSGVPEVLYRQAGGRCSFPRCKNPTMGPFYEREGAVNMGVACHIHSAALNGPRGRGGKDDAFLSSEKNGIWCCQYHAGLIDKAQGIDYPAAVLFRWKALAEARTRKQMNDSPSPLGWVESIEFTSFPVHKNLPKITLSRWTLMYGANYSGKTSLLQAAASVSHSMHVERFGGLRIQGAEGKSQPAKFCAKIIYSTVDSLSKELNIEIEGQKIKRSESGIPCLLPPGDLEVIFDKDCKQLDSEDDIDFMQRVLNVDKSALLTLADIGTNTIISGEIKFDQAEDWNDEAEKLDPKCKDDGTPYYELNFKFSSKESFIPLNSLSGSEKNRLILDLLITKAREISKQRLTLLLIESLAVNFDAGNFETLLRALSNEDFQVIVSLPFGRENDILEKTSYGLVLKELKYLDSWRLAVIGNSDES